MENILFIGFALLFLTLMSAHVYTTNAFFLRLKERHEDIWKKLGEPRWKIHFGEKSFQDAMGYIRKKKFLDLNDEKLEALYKKIKRVEYGSVAIALIIIVITVIDILIG